MQFYYIYIYFNTINYPYFHLSLPKDQPDIDDRDYNSEDDIADEIMQNERRNNPTGANGNIQGKIFNTNLFTKPSN